MIIDVDSWVEQPAPIKNEHPAVWDLVLRDMEGAKFGHPDQRKTHLLMVEHIKLRDRTGEKKYGVRLQPFNGRNALQDAYEEFLDAIVYLRQALYEQTKDAVLVTTESEFFQSGITFVYTAALDSALKLCYMIEKQKEKIKNEQSVIDTSNN